MKTDQFILFYQPLLNLKTGGRHAENRGYVASLCKTCRDLNIEVVAKSVEDLSMLGTLRNIGVDYAQGFAVGIPLESLGEFGVVT